MRQKMQLWLEIVLTSDRCNVKRGKRMAYLYLQMNAACSRFLA